MLAPLLFSARPACEIVRDLVAQSPPGFGSAPRIDSSCGNRFGKLAFRAPRIDSSCGNRVGKLAFRAARIDFSCGYRVGKLAFRAARIDFSCGNRFGKLAFRPRAGAACAAHRHLGPAAAGARTRMSSTPADQPSVASKSKVGDAENASKTVNVIIKGKVQGVYYRNWTVDSAQQLNVNGWVRNLKDGSVEAVFSGKSATVDSLIQKCHQGPPAARVSSVEVSAWEDDVAQGFERKPTIW